MNLALDPTRDWTGEYKVDFRDVLPELIEGTESTWTSTEDDDAPVFSLVTGRYEQRQRHQELPTAHNTEEESTALLSRNMNTHLTLQYESPAAQRLATKDFRGLEVRMGQDAPHAAIPGQRGIACSYENLKQ